MVGNDSINRARIAAAERRWPDAYAAYRQSPELAREDLEPFALASFLVGDMAGSVDLRQRLFAECVQGGDDLNAGSAALNVALAHFGRGMASIGTGWLEQAERYLSPHPGTEEFATLLWVRVVLQGEGGGDLDELLGASREVIAEARRVGNTDVEALGRLLEGQLLIRLGDVDGGARILDQVMALAVGGCLGPFATSWVYCGTISTCASVGDVKRAWEWTSEASRCSVQPGLSDFPGDCRLHRAELLRVRGVWTEAETEIARICDDLASWHVGHVGTAHYELGELSLRRGDLNAAETAFTLAEQYGVSPEPGLSVLRLERGEHERAAAGIRKALHDERDNGTRRIPLLATAVDVAVAQGLLEWAAECVDDLHHLVALYRAPLQRARAAHATATVAFVSGDLDTAARQFGDAIGSWREIGAPYEVARSRASLGAVELARGNRDAYRSELAAALAEFERLGAVLDAQRAAALLGRARDVARVQRALMFTDIERSTDLLAAIGDDAWIDLLRWHDSQLRALFDRHHGHEIHQKGGGDGFFIAFNTPDAALGCALAIQDLLRTETDRGLVVRIGVHWAEVTHTDGDYSGRGVHEAARVAALADGGQILTTTTTLAAAAGAYATGSPQTVTLRGLPGEVAVITVHPEAQTSKVEA